MKWRALLGLTFSVSISLATQNLCVTYFSGERVIPYPETQNTSAVVRHTEYTSRVATALKANGSLVQKAEQKLNSLKDLDTDIVSKDKEELQRLIKRIHISKVQADQWLGLLTKSGFPFSRLHENIAGTVFIQSTANPAHSIPDFLGNFDSLSIEGLKNHVQVFEVESEANFAVRRKMAVASVSLVKDYFNVKDYFKPGSWENMNTAQQNELVTEIQNKFNENKPPTAQLRNQIETLISIVKKDGGPDFLTWFFETTGKDITKQGIAKSKKFSDISFSWLSFIAPPVVAVLANGEMSSLSMAIPTGIGAAAYYSNWVNNANGPLAKIGAKWQAYKGKRSLQDSIRNLESTQMEETVQKEIQLAPIDNLVNSSLAAVKKDLQDGLPEHPIFLSAWGENLSKAFIHLIEKRSILQNNLNEIMQTLDPVINSMSQENVRLHLSRTRGLISDSTRQSLIELYMKAAELKVETLSLAMALDGHLEQFNDKRKNLDSMYEGLYLDKQKQLESQGKYLELMADGLTTFDTQITKAITNVNDVQQAAISDQLTRATEMLKRKTP